MRQRRQRGRIVGAIVGAAAFGACSAPPVQVAPSVVPSEGIAIAIYREGEAGFGVVDDRRRVILRDGAIVLDRIEPRVSLETLLIEPLDLRDSGIGRRDPGTGRGDLGIGACVREREAPRVRCAVEAGAGRERFLRVLYVDPALRYRARHHLVLAGDGRATLSTRLRVTTPRWRRRARLTLFAGVPGGGAAPRELAHRDVMLDGDVVEIALPAREVGARLVRVLAREGDRDGTVVVRRWLVLDQPRLVPGTARVELRLPGEPAREVIAGAAELARVGTGIRIPLWLEADLNATRRTSREGPVERIELAVENAGGEPREVWIEERLRPGFAITAAWPTRPVRARDRVRFRVIVEPGATERVGLTVRYTR